MVTLSITGSSCWAHSACELSSDEMDPSKRHQVHWMSSADHTGKPISNRHTSEGLLSETCLEQMSQVQ